MSGGQMKVGIQENFRRLADQAPRARAVVPRGRFVIVNGKRYVAFSAHELLEFASDINTSRPGHPA